MMTKIKPHFQQHKSSEAHLHSSQEYNAAKLMATHGYKFYHQRSKYNTKNITRL